LGDVGTGKTAILHGLNRVVRLVFPPDGGRCKVIDESPLRYTLKAGRITFNEEDARPFPPRITDLVNADCIVLCFSLTDLRSFHSVRQRWYAHALAHASVPLVLVGTHADVPPVPIKQPLGASLPVHESLAIPSESPKFCASNLPTSVVLRVFSYLPNLDLARSQRVCRQWASLGRHEYLWNTRTAGSVPSRSVRTWLRQVGNIKYYSVSLNDDASMAKLWKRVAKCALLNESKMYIMRVPEGEVLSSRRPLVSSDDV
jgi:GTPase SAR1 family protein